MHKYYCKKQLVKSFLILCWSFGLDYSKSSSVSPWMSDQDALAWPMRILFEGNRLMAEKYDVI